MQKFVCLFCCFFVCDAMAIVCDTVACCTDNIKSTVCKADIDSCWSRYRCGYGCKRGYVKDADGICVVAACSNTSSISCGLTKCCVKDDGCPNGLLCMCTNGLDKCPAYNVCYGINAKCNASDSVCTQVCTLVGSENANFLTGKGTWSIEIKTGKYCRGGYYVSGTSCEPCPDGGTSDATIFAPVSKGSAISMHSGGISSCYLGAGTSYVDDSGTFEVVEGTKCYHQ